MVTDSEKNCIRCRKWNKENKEYRKEQNKKYREAHREEILNYLRKYREHNREKIRLYRQTLSYKQSKIKAENKRIREFKTIPINEWFPGSEGHHIDKKYVVYIPKKLHDKWKGTHRLSNPNTTSSIDLEVLQFLGFSGEDVEQLII